MNFMICIVGWALWNWGQFTLEKRMKDNDGDDKTVFTFKEYRNKQWPTWIGSLLCIPAILFVMYRQIDVDPFASLIAPGVKLGKTDLYFFCAGLVFEAIIFGIQTINSFFAKKRSQL